MTAPLHVLLVDDSEIDREQICILFDEVFESPKVSVASTAAEGLSALRRTWFDCALLDYRLPDGDAFGMLDALSRSPRPSPPAVVVTGVGSERVAADSLKRGARDYLSKDDLTAESLLEAVNGAISNHRRRTFAAGGGLLLPEDPERILEEVVAATLHDIQTPVRNLNQLARELQTSIPEASVELTALVENLRGEAYTASRRVRDLLRFARLRRDSEWIDGVDPGDALRMAQLDFDEDLRELGGMLIVDELPRVAASNFQLADVFRALIDNCLKYRSKDPLEIYVHGRRFRDEVLITIDDNGQGIPAEHAERVFGLFQRLERGDAYAGSGLGLALARRIVHLHGGLIWLEEKDRGTRICFTLPAAE